MRKIVQNLLIFVYLFCLKSSTIDSRRTSIVQEWLVVKSCPIPRWIAFLILYRMAQNIRSQSKELILAWSAYWTLINLDPEKHGVNIGWKPVFNFGELYFSEAIHNTNCISSVTLIRCLNFMDHKKQNLSLYSSNIVCLQ